MDTTRPHLDTLIAILREHEKELMGLGVTHAAVFGSTARGEADEDSDLDILVSLKDENDLDLLGYAEIAANLRTWTGLPVGLAVRERLKPEVRPNALKEAVNAF